MSGAEISLAEAEGGLRRGCLVVKELPTDRSNKKLARKPGSDYLEKQQKC